MSYIWQNYDKNRKYIIDKYSFSPFLEVGLPYTFAATAFIGVNTLIRLQSIFSTWNASREALIKESAIGEGDAAILEDTVLHLLALLDRKCGAHIYSCTELKLHNMLLKGRYGKEIAELYGEIFRSENIDSDRVCKSILKWLRKHEAMQGRELFFKKAVSDIFPSSKFYYNNQDQSYIVYIPKTCSDFDSRTIRLLELLFMEATAETYIFWDKHFGIINNKETMLVGNIAIY